MVAFLMPPETFSLPEILFLKDWRTSRLQWLWIYFKIAVKEGLLAGDWSSLSRLGGRYGSVTIVDTLEASLKDGGLKLKSAKNKTEKTDVAVVFRDVRNLWWALEQKRKGLINRLVVGPFIATVPSEYKSVLEDPLIDDLVFLSDWHRQLFLRLAKRPVATSHIWFAGVDVEKWKPQENSQRDSILIYDKESSASEIEQVKNALKRRGLKYSVISYGSYEISQFKAELERSKFVIFLHRTETQGLASFEAWSMNCPTLHHNPGVMRHVGIEYAGASSCPYLHESCGLDFQNWSLFEDKLGKMISLWHGLNPRAHVIENYTLEKSRNRYLSILGLSRTGK